MSNVNNCILESDLKDKDIKQFEEEIQKLINKKNLELKNIIFPNGYDYSSIFNRINTIAFWNCEFNSTNYDIEFKNIKKCHYYDCKFNEKWLHLDIDSICYSNSTFNKDIFFFNQEDGSKTETINQLQFNDCIFEKKFNLDSSADNMPKCNIKILDIQNCIFKKSILINNCTITSYCTFANNTVENISEFENNEFNTTSFVLNKFQDTVSFYESTFNKLNLEKNSFSQLVILQNTNFKQALNLTNNLFKNDINFFDITLEKDVKNRETARIIKHSFEKQDNIIEANKFYTLEMQKREKELKFKNSPLDWIVFKFHKTSSNHSQDWLLTLLWIINITFVYSAFKQELCVNQQWLYLFSFLSIGIIITLIECLAILELNRWYKGMIFLILVIINWISYVWVTCDYTLLCVANTFNPFSSMTEKASLTFIELIYKIAIAYLIYQLIISIRQNTRRK